MRRVGNATAELDEPPVSALRALNARARLGRPAKPGLPLYRVRLDFGWSLLIALRSGDGPCDVDN